MIQETLRFHPNTGEILERRVPDGGASIDGYQIPGGVIVGVNAWVLHFDKDIFGQDADQFRPERWLDSSEEQKQEMRRFVFAVSGHSSAVTPCPEFWMLAKHFFAVWSRVPFMHR